MSFTSSTGSATGASFASADDPSGSRSSMLVSLKKVFESVYKCDSLAIVDGASRCGSVANQALYQGVEVILKTTSCSNSYGTKNLTDSVKESVASKPFFEFQCFCDDDDFIVNNEVWRCNTIACTNPATNNNTAAKSQHVRNGSSGSQISGESRNEHSNPSGATASLFVATDHDDAMRIDAVPEESEEAVIIRRSKWTAHTKSFYSKISPPTQRVVTKLSDLETPTISPRRTRLSAELVPSVVSKIEDDLKNTNDDNIEIIALDVEPTSSRWLPRSNISEIREQ